MRVIARTFIIQSLTLLLFGLLWWLLAPASAHAAGKAAVEAISYPAVAAVVSATLLLAKTIEQLLSKAGLLRSEQEKQIDKIYDWLLDSRKSGSRMIEDLYSWHKPIETPSGTRFLWRDSGEHAAAERAILERIEESASGTARQSLVIAHALDVLVERLEREGRLIKKGEPQ